MICRAKVFRIARFGAVGACSTVIYAGLAFGFGELGFQSVAASMAAYALSAVFSFVAHRRVTFGSTGSVRAELPRFVAINIGGFTIATLVPLILTEGLRLNPAIAVAATCTLVPVLSYMLMQRFVFRPAALEPGPSAP